MHFIRDNTSFIPLRFPLLYEVLHSFGSFCNVKVFFLFELGLLVSQEVSELTPFSVLSTKAISSHLLRYKCCKRWFITFNGAECNGPMALDAVLWVRRGAGYDEHRPGSIEGYCQNIHKGKIRVGINIGNCKGYGNSDGHTGWNSVSRLIIEEVPRPQ